MLVTILLQPLDRYRTPSAIGSAIGEAPISPYLASKHSCGSPQPPRSKPLWGAQPRDSGAIVSKTPLKQAQNKNAMGSDRGRDSQPRPRPRLNSQPQGATKSSGQKTILYIWYFSVIVLIVDHPSEGVSHKSEKLFKSLTTTI